MSSNNNQKYIGTKDCRKYYIKAKQYEERGFYKEAIQLYEFNISNYNDPKSKVQLAKLYLTGKTPKINNVKARNLLEESIDQNCNEGKVLLAYTLANGIGGNVERIRAYTMFWEELKDKNPDAMIYIELSKMITKSKKTQALLKSLNKSVTPIEKFKHHRLVMINKFNNTILGKIVNKIPNKVAVTFDYFIREQQEKSLSYSLGYLHDRAEKFYKQEDYITSRRIYERLASYCDSDSQIKYAKMCSEGIGGKQDIDLAKETYKSIIYTNNLKLNEISFRIKNIKNAIDNCNYDKKSKKYLKFVEKKKEKIQELKERRYKILSNKYYNEAYLQYGKLCVNYYSDNAELNNGIEILKTFAKDGECVPGKNKCLTQNGKNYNRQARIAIKQLGQLFEDGVWTPKTLEEKNMFDKFATSKISGYTSYISDKINGKDVKIIQIKKSEKIKCNMSYELGTLCELFHINFLARKFYTNMCKKGDYRRAFSLAMYEQYGKGGNKDIESAIKHYKNYIQLTINKDHTLEKSLALTAVNNLGNIYESQNDIDKAVDFYKIAAIKGNSNSKKALKALYNKNMWTPKSFYEQELVKPTVVEVIRKKISDNTLKIKNSIKVPKIDFRKPVAVGVASMITMFAGDSMKSVEVYSENINNKTTSNDKNIDYNYTIGDEVSIFDGDMVKNFTIIGMSAYNAETKKIFDEKIELDSEKFGLKSQAYKNNIAQKQNIPTQTIDLLYCLKNGNENKWISLNEFSQGQFVIRKPYQPVKKQDDFEDYLL